MVERELAWALAVSWQVIKMAASAKAAYAISRNVTGCFILSFLNRAGAVGVIEYAGCPASLA